MTATPARCCATAPSVRAHASGGVTRFEEDDHRRCRTPVGILPAGYTPTRVVMHFHEVATRDGAVGFYCKRCNRITEYSATTPTKAAA